MENTNQDVTNSLINNIKANITFTITMGGILLILGLLAMVTPFVAGLSIVFVTGVILIIAGITQLIFGIKNGFQLSIILLGALNVFMGGYMLAQPSIALATLTVFLVIYLIITGFSEIFIAFKLRPTQNWIWTLLSGIAAVILGFMIWRQFPFSGVWTIGFLLGVKLVFGGWALLLLGLTTKKELSE